MQCVRATLQFAATFSHVRMLHSNRLHLRRVKATASLQSLASRRPSSRPRDYLSCGGSRNRDTWTNERQQFSLQEKPDPACLCRLFKLFNLDDSVESTKIKMCLLSHQEYLKCSVGDLLCSPHDEPAGAGNHILITAGY